MKKKQYIAPSTSVLVYQPIQILAGSLDPEKEQQSVTPQQSEYDGEFQSRYDRNYKAWEDEEEYEDNGGW